MPAPAVPPKSTGWQRPAFLSSLSSASTTSSVPPQQNVSTPVSPTVQMNSTQTTPAQQTQQQSLLERKKNNRMSMDAWVPSFWRGTSGAANPASAATASTSSSTTPAAQAVLQPPLPGFKPMMLSSRRLSNDMEDEADQITRARLQSEMKLLGLDNAGSPILHTAPAMTGQPAGSRLSVGRSPSNRLSGLFSALSSSPNASANISTPPRDDAVSVKDRDSRSDTSSGRLSGLADVDRPVVTSAVESVKFRGAGHRKRPSAGARDSIIGSATASPAQAPGLPSPSHAASANGASIGLGFSYSSGGSSSVSGARSPSVTSVSAAGDSNKEGHRTSDQSIRSEVSQS